MKVTEIQKVIFFYKRLPNNQSEIPAIVLCESEDFVITINMLYPSSPLVIDNFTLIDNNYLGVWFSSTTKYYDIGAIYTQDKKFKGYYCDLCTPLKRIPEGFESTDLVLDLWIFPNGEYRILDEKEYHQAVKKKWITIDQKKIVETELQRITDMIKLNNFPSKQIKKYLQLPQNIEEILHVLK